MSRRHGRGHHHERPRHEGPKPGSSGDARAVGAAAPDAPKPAAPSPQPAVTPPTLAPAPNPTPETAPLPPQGSQDAAAPHDRAPQPNGAPKPNGAAAQSGAPHQNGGPRPNGAPHANGAPHHNGAPVAATADAPRPTNGHDRNMPCTAPQLRRFIKSRPYVPMHELRRRFAIDGGDDDVSAVQLDPGCIYVGLPQREGALLGELLRAGEIGYELSLDPRTPIVVGVYPMRPVPRP